MANIYLSHPVHGSKVANSIAEADADKANGWSEFNPVAEPISTSQPEPEQPILNTLPTRRGRRPKQVE